MFFTSYLYHLPQAVLAVIVMMAVFSLIRVAPLVHAWKVDRVGASIGVLTFAVTLLMAPAIADGILFGIALTVLHFLIRTMKPRAEVISRKADGSLGGIRAHRLTPISEHFLPVRFDGSLTFVNVAYFEDMILEAHADYPQARTILVVGSGINEVDASGEEKIREVARRLREVGVSLVFSSVKHQVMRVFEKSGLIDELGRDAFFTDKETAVHKLIERFHGPANTPSYMIEGAAGGR
jgi:MFS superfamily sulfate permease-like transporter